MQKNLSTAELPSKMKIAGRLVLPVDYAGPFAKIFDDKVKSNSSRAKISDSIYNGTCKLLVQNCHFMKPSDVKACLNDLCNKKCEGFDRILTCVLYNCRSLLTPTLSQLFDKIYSSGCIPEQWKIAKVVPIFKKGNKDEIENYRPIANLCSTSKVFKKLIFELIHYLESTNKLDLTGKKPTRIKKIGVLQMLVPFYNS